MTQKAVEGLLGRLITDRSFRSRFFEEPQAACTEENLDVTSRELAALLALDELRVEELTKQLDPKIVRADMNGNGEATGRTARVVVRQPARAGGVK